MALGDYAVGSSGAGVRDLQSYLREVGYNVTVDGIYGPETRATVLAFQQARGIRADGIAGPETLITLSLARGEGWRATVAPQMVPSHDPNSPSYDPNAMKPPGSKWTGLVILLAIAVGAWLLTQKRPTRGLSRVDADQGPQGKDDEEEEEPEDEEEEEEEEEDDD